MTTEEQRDDCRPCVFSVLIGLVSTEDRDRVLETLGALRGQERAPAFEVIIADRRQDLTSQAIRTRFPEVRLISCPPNTSIPELRTVALESARGEYVAVTEDHCIPHSDWLAQMLEAFRTGPKGTVAVGGCVENGAGDTGLDWATFLCEYSALLPPVSEGPVTTLAGMNVAYRRSAITGLDRSLLTNGFWETTIHPNFVRTGGLQHQTNRIRLWHKKRFSFGLFARQRFLYSRYYAGRRFGQGQVVRRLVACCMTVALPPLLLARIVASILVKRHPFVPLLRALPNLLAFVVIWACGEMVGYVLGPGDALSKIE